MAATSSSIVDPVYVVELGKVETEVTSSASGVLRRGSAEPGEVDAVGTLLGVIEQDS